MTPDDLKRRTKQLALRAINLSAALPASVTGGVIAKQLVRSATSVGANYRAACRGRSRAEFAAKLAIVIEEADESCYWLELVVESGLLHSERVDPLLAEANEIVAIMVASRKTATC